MAASTSAFLLSYWPTSRSLSARSGSQVGWSDAFCVAVSGLCFLSGFFGAGASAGFEDDSCGGSWGRRGGPDKNTNVSALASTQLSRGLASIFPYSPGSGPPLLPSLISAHMLVVSLEI